MLPEKYTILILICSIAISILFTIISTAVSKKLGFLDKPYSAKHKTHRSPMPISGGLSLWGSFALLFIFFQNEFSPLINTQVILGLVIIFITGLLDDIFIFPASIKLFGQIAGSGLIVSGGIITHLFNGGLPDWIITIFWLIGIMNAFNFLDGADGIILETALIISGSLIVFTLLSSQAMLNVFLFAFFGILLGLLYFNAPPARIFMGDSGSQTIGVVLAIVTLLYNPLGHDRYSSWITPIVMMFIPIFDVTLVVLSRIRRKLPIYRGGLDHTYHRLLQRGLTPRQANLLMSLLVLLSTIIAFGILKANQEISYLILGGLLLLGGYAIYRLDHHYQPKQ